MKRRALLLASGALMLAGPSRALAQGAKAPRRIAVLLPGTQSAYRRLFDTFRAELRQLGYAEGRDIVIEARWADYKLEQLGALAAELVSLKPSVIFTATSAAVDACRKATSTIPIVFATSLNPVEQGYAASLARPGGNMTGVVLHSGVAAKLVEIAREALPQAKKLGILVYSADPVHSQILSVFVPAARQFRFEPVVVHIRQAEELAVAFNQVLAHKPGALYLPEQSFIRAHVKYLAERSLAAKLPLLASNEEFAAAGCLLTYGTPREENYRRAARMVDKILKGASAGELPMEQPERFELIVNLKAAKALGITLPQTFLIRASRVIE